MKCEKVITKYLESDDKYRIPLLVKIHTYFCPGCSNEISKLMAAMDLLENDSIWKTERNITGYVMDRISLQSVYSEKRVSGIKWILIGAVIISSILLINFSDSFIWLKEQYGSNFVIPLSIVLGLAITAYMMILTLSNYDYLEKYLHYIYKGKGKY